MFTKNLCKKGKSCRIVCDTLLPLWWSINNKKSGKSVYSDDSAVFMFIMQDLGQ